MDIKPKYVNTLESFMKVSSSRYLEINMYVNFIIMRKSLLINWHMID